ncbi:tRNA 5-methoxyuridine(34)/uridine 5-oxyacetic acid(34) synthase CmoB [Methylomicrobium sp. Wu6]|uniref:tRNA 5-methoxyuridine(34)/uridine 5-oxyacetic acid(34) synthase CmoB n=1 Tax=Methylomicrobium sp. Wu6 TaxID=3107928 RepID=UPI002DD6994B|nr:tRNA 5-methoxyuridine(34)/uridine 5-oxyacetic acid(34) synthase CmoB [Methylomicrobium sp. Wu6]MEC4748274.1 tRNA 5-methoxyuridine(34)/uridine 5-oxyacetic acid(34) synthase CmoB [Methylomicrobium sp. Wu6]
MSAYQDLYSALREAKADAWADTLPEQIAAALDPARHGNLPRWQALLDRLPLLSPSLRCLTSDSVQIGRAEDIAVADRALLSEIVRELIPWRKGPYDLYGIQIDTEWRSDLKWERLKDHISPLQHRLVLDVGCGSGYHCWRMFGAGARTVVGIDPLLLNVIQFQLVKTLYGPAPVHVLPFGIEALPKGLKAFDTVFSMGVLYHRRSPIDHLQELRDCLQPGGELVLETLIIDGKLGETLLPEDRYANMRNIWFIPSLATLESWLKRCRFDNIRVVDITPTRIDEQRSTEWMPFHSLADFLKPNNPELTVEGLPAPKRAIVLANSG